MSETALDLTAPAFLGDRYGAYAGVRSRRMIRLDWIDAWLVLDHDTVLHVLRGRTFRPTAGAARNLQTACGAHHARLKATVAAAFRPAAVQRMRSWIGEVAAGIADRCLRPSPVDLMRLFAHRLSISVIGGILGLPEERLPALCRAIDTLAGTMGPDCRAEAAAQAGSARDVIRRSLAETIAERRRAPRQDLISRLVRDPRLDADEATAMVRLLLVTASHPTALAIGNAAAALLQRPRQLARLRAQPHLLDSAVEECLRMEAPIQLASRTACAGVELGGHQVRAGEEVLLAYGSANRDPDVFEQAEVLRVGRRTNPHVAFGRGEHACLAPSLGRAVLSAALAELFLAGRRIELAGDPEPLTSATFQGLRALPVLIGSPGRLTGPASTMNPALGWIHREEVRGREA